MKRGKKPSASIPIPPPRISSPPDATSPRHTAEGEPHIRANRVTLGTSSRGGLRIAFFADPADSQPLGWHVFRSRPDQE